MTSLFDHHRLSDGTVGLFAPVEAPHVSTSPEKPHYHGHRQRLRERFLRGGAEALPDYELLELILFASNPRSDVKPLAKILLSRFGSFPAVLSADIRQLETVEGLTQAGLAALKASQAAALRLLQGHIRDKPVISNWQALLDYCRVAMSEEKTEQLRILFLDNKNRLIEDEVQQRGTINHTPIYPREVAKRALELSCSALILVHNHPSGDPTPSGQDITMTETIRNALEALDIRLHDHVIIGGDDHVSFKSLGLL